MASNGKRSIKIDKFEWTQIGQRYGWMKSAQGYDPVAQSVKDVQELMAKEQEYRQHGADIPQMEEATSEDLDAGYGYGMENKKYIDSLSEPYVQVEPTETPDAFTVFFYGNYEPSSVNAGRSKKIFLAHMNKNQLDSFHQAMKSLNVEVV